MGQFSIYKKSEKLVWTRSRIILAALFFSLLIFDIEYLCYGEFKKNNFNYFIGGIMYVAFIAGMINNFFEEQLKGHLEGKIFFELDHIRIGDRVISLETINFIEFMLGDYKGMIITHNFPYGMFSAGVSNRVSLVLQSGEEITVIFQRNYETEMRKIIYQLMHYREKEKMTEKNYFYTINQSK